MKDDTQECAITVGVAYLSPSQIDAYGGFAQAQKALGVAYICHPDTYREKSVGPCPGMLPVNFHECGHA